MEPYQAERHPPFSQKVVDAMRALFPEQLADKSWDNVGLLVGNIGTLKGHSPGAESVEDSTTVLLTNDLTEEVAQEAISIKASTIVSYHPFIFRGLKAITTDDPQQRILLRLARHNIAVYSPHTAVDAAPGGLNDWLADMLCGDEAKAPTRSVVQPLAGPAPAPAGFEGAGYGRLCAFADPVPFDVLVHRLAAGLGGMRYVMVAVPPAHRRTAQSKVRSAAVCAGSGYDVLAGCGADVLVTGEMSHHHALRATMEGRYVVTVFHSNSERLFLAERLRPLLQARLEREAKSAQVLVSQQDRDPFEIWDLRSWA